MLDDRDLPGEHDEEVGPAAALAEQGLVSGNLPPFTLRG
jgi:hypothetical protein